jgi:hypothetical protein
VRLAWPQLALLGLFVVTLARVILVRAHATSEGVLELSAEAVWGMVAFATLPVVAAIGALYAAWQARAPRADAPWDSVDVHAIGGAESVEVRERGDASAVGVAGVGGAES